MSQSPINTTGDKRNRDTEHLQGHWLLAKLGKKVLRPGGKKLTEWMINTANPTAKRVVEFAPGLGITAEEILNRNPRHYTGVDENPQAASTTHTSIANSRLGIPTTMITGTAADTGLDSGSADVVVGEAMLTMQGAKGKDAIISEAHRLLVPGGRYAIHELALVPNDVDEEVADKLRKELAAAIKVNARPLTPNEWSELLESHGFNVVATKVAPMGLLDPKQLVDDEGLRVFTILFNLLRYPAARRRVLAMRSVFSSNADNLASISIVCEKTDAHDAQETAEESAQEAGQDSQGTQPTDDTREASTE